MIESQFELFLLAGHFEEVVRRLEFSRANDWELSSKLEPERLVEGRLFSGSVIRYIVSRYIGESYDAGGRRLEA